VPEFTALDTKALASARSSFSSSSRDSPILTALWEARGLFTSKSAARMVKRRSIETGLVPILCDAAASLVKIWGALVGVAASDVAVSTALAISQAMVVCVLTTQMLWSLMMSWVPQSAVVIDMGIAVLMMVWSSGATCARILSNAASWALSTAASLKGCCMRFSSLARSVLERVSAPSPLTTALENSG
jgi:hypothetical protein